MNFIGTVKSRFEQPADPDEMREGESVIVVEPEYEEGLYRIEDNDYIQVVFGFHLARGYTLKGPRRGGTVRGVFASRSPGRPTPVGITTVRLLAREGRRLRVKGLDAVDGTPVLDLKPYVSVMDGPEPRSLAEEELKTNPRRQINDLIISGDLPALLLKAGELHGHFCPFLSLGVKAGAYALQQLGLQSDGLEDLIAIVETNSCFSDGIQYSTGCSLGNNALIYRDYGKTAVTVTRRGGEGIRLYVKDTGDLLNERYPRAMELFQKVIVDRKGTEQEKEDLKKAWGQIAFGLVKLPVEDLFKIEKGLSVELPSYAPMFGNKNCSQCGEKMMASRAVQEDGRDLCIPCAAAGYLQLDGAGLCSVSGEER